MSKSRKHAQLAEFWRRFRKNKTAVLGLVILIIILSMALFADLIVPYSKCIDQVGADRLQGPSMAHFFGTDELGRDLFARVVHGSRYSLLIGLATSLMALVIGAVLGASAGYFGGWWTMSSAVLWTYSCAFPPFCCLWRSWRPWAQTFGT